MTIGVPLRLAAALRSSTPRARGRTIALGVKDDQVDVMEFGELDGLSRPPRFERRRAVARQERRQDFARISRFVDDQHTRRKFHRVISVAEGWRAAVERIAWRCGRGRGRGE